MKRHLKFLHLITVQFILFLTLSLNAQFGINNFQIVWGETFRGRIDALHIIDAIGRNPSLASLQKSFFHPLFRNAGKLLVKHTNSLSYSYATTFQLEVDKKRTTPTHVLPIGNNDLLTIGKRSGIFQRQQTVYYHYFNKQGTDRKVQGQKITEYNRTSRLKSELFTGVALSEDHSKAVIHYSIPVGRNDYPGFGYLLFDEIRGKSEENLTVLPYKMNELDVYDHFITNKGNYFMIGKEFSGRNIYTPSITTQGTVLRTRIFSHQKERGLREIPMTELPFFPQDIKFTEEKDQLLLTGFYAESPGADIRGVFFATLDSETLEIRKVTSSPFSREFIETGKAAWEKSYWERVRSNRNRVTNFNNFKILEFQQTKNGEYIVVAEHQEVEARLKNSNNENASNEKLDYIYYYEDVLVYKLSKEGELLWVNRIPKSQRSQNDDGKSSSSLVAITDKEVYVLFNDNIRNYDNSTKKYQMEDRYPFNASTGNQNVIGVSFIDLSNGIELRKMVGGRRELRTLFIPKKSIFMPETKELYLYGNINRRHRLGYVKL